MNPKYSLYPKRTFLCLFILIGIGLCTAQHTKGSRVTDDHKIIAVNAAEIAKGQKTIAILGATLIDGTGAPPVKNALVIVNNGLIDRVGTADEENIPDDATVVDAKGKVLLPGLIDAHFHGADADTPRLFLRKGVTSGTGSRCLERRLRRRPKFPENPFPDCSLQGRISTSIPRPIPKTRT